MAEENKSAETQRVAPPWYKFAKRYEGKKETDPEFNKEMSAKWALFGLSFGTIAKNWAAWCGLFIAVSLSGAGYQYAKNGAGAMNWGKTAALIYIDWKKDGIPQGAIVYVNHAAKCFSGSNNHVTMANGDCAPVDLLKRAATFNGFGGNQGNTARVNAFPVAHICTVGWPKDADKPPKIIKSVNCVGKAGAPGSTR